MCRQTSPLASFISDPLYTTLNQNPNPPTTWQLHNLTNLKYLTQNNIFRPFSDLQVEYNLTDTEQIDYNKIKLFYQNYYSLTLQTPFTNKYV